MNKLTLTQILFVLCFFVSACKNDSTSTPTPDTEAAVPDSARDDNDTFVFNGTADSGGGDIEKSTEADVREAVYKTLDVITAEKFFWKISQTGTLKYDDLTDEEKEKLFQVKQVLSSPTFMVVLKMSQLKEDATAGEEDAYLDSMDSLMKKYSSRQLKDYVDPQQIYFTENGPCPSKDKKNAYASVEAHEIGTRVCFSIENLKTIPKISLHRYIAGLWAHEIVHMFGFGEVTANRIQEETIRGFLAAMNSSAKNVPYLLYSPLINVSATMTNARFSLVKVLSSYSAEEALLSGRNLRFSMGMIVGHLNTFLRIFDEENMVIKVFHSTDVQEMQLKVKQGISRLDSFALESNTLSDDQLISKGYLNALEAEEKQFEIVLENYRKIVDYYQSLEIVEE
jgi:hypothetical protein